MPEIVLPSVRQIANGASEQAHQKLQEMRQAHQIQMWSLEGTAEECEDSWRAFLLRDTPDWIIYSS